MPTHSLLDRRAIETTNLETPFLLESMKGRNWPRNRETMAMADDMMRNRETMAMADDIMI